MPGARRQRGNVVDRLRRMKARVARFVDELVDDEIRREGVDAPRRADNGDPADVPRATPEPPAHS